MANSQAIVSALYAKVVTDVIAKSREEFLGEGLDATVLEELRVRWERKLAQSGVAPTGGVAPTAAAAKAPAVSAQKAPTSAATAAPAPPPAVLAPSAAAPPSAPPQAARDEPLALLGRPLAFLPAATGWIVEAETPAAPAPALPHTEPSPAQDAGRKRKAPDSTAEDVAAAAVAQAQVATAPPAPAAPAPQAAGSSDEDEDDAGLSSGSDDSDKRDVETSNLVLSQFEKVSHTKNKWKCTLKSGVMTLNGKDRVFSSATGAFNW